MKESDRLVRLLQVFVATIETLDEEQIDELLSGKVKLAITSPRRMKDASVVTPEEAEALLSKLTMSEDRVVARRVLGEISSRDALVAFARSMKVHVVKHDRRDDIENKIVEFVVGGKLRSEAIQSLNMKSGSKPFKDRDNEN